MKYAIIGGSVSRSFGLDLTEEDWPRLFQRLVEESGKVHRVESIGFLNPSSLSKVLEQMDQTETLIIHMGTSVGWPVIKPPVERFLRPESRHDGAFHLPVRAPEDFHHALKRFLRHLLRNLLKLCAFPFGLYRPRQSLKTLDDDVRRALKLTSRLATDVIWIQHRSLGYRRLVLERIIYRRYYKKITLLLRQSADTFERFHLLEIPDDFLIQENFTLDGVHLSAAGHLRFAHLVEREIREMNLGEVSPH
jgi:hypothetical protein